MDLEKAGDVSSFLRLPEGTTWPDPSDPREVGWRLRYGQASREDLIWATSVISAYRQLISVTGKRRSEVVRQIKAAPHAGQ